MSKLTLTRGKLPSCTAATLGFFGDVGDAFIMVSTDAMSPFFTAPTSCSGNTNYEIICLTWGQNMMLSHTV